MEFNKRAVAFAFVSFIALSAFGCKGPTGNSNNPQSATGAAPKPGKWVAQYRAPASLSYSAMDLAVFYYTGISVVSLNVVFVCGDTPNAKGDERMGVIVRTTDGGQNWTDTPIDIPKMHIPTLNAIHFISPDVGWAVGVDSGEDGVVVKTTDGGSSWTATRISQKQVPTAVFFVDADNGWMGAATPPPGEDEGLGGPSALLTTTDGGLTWQTRYNLPISIYRVFFFDKMNGWASGSKGVIYNTSDGGLTWNTQRTEIETGDGPQDLHGEGMKQFAVRGLQFIDEDNGFAAATATEGVAGRLLVTSNGGVAWRRQWIVTNAGVRDIFFVSPNEGWALTEGPYVYHTVDGGRSWLSEPKVFEQDVTLSRLGGVDAGHIWAVGAGAIFFRVSD
ncbi:MAG: YCF48-related protein [Acidobacteriota bacterium]